MSGDGVPVGVELLCQVYADAYHHGHHATVEGGYVDVLPVDRDTYWREKVEEDYAEELAQHPAAVDGAISPADLCALSRVFNANNNLRPSRGRRINDWLGKHIAAALAAQQGGHR